MRVFLGEAVFVHADDGFLAGVDAGLAAGGGFLDAHLGDAGFDGLGHAAVVPRLP